MKKTLPARSSIIKGKLEKVIEEILVVARDRIAMIILFGSYARGDWVQDMSMKDGMTYYISDLDILILLRKNKHSAMTYRIIKDIENRLERRKSFSGPSVSFITEPISKVTDLVEERDYFYSDIFKEGILLYDNGEYQLPEPKKISPIKRKQKAEGYYEYWFKRGIEFLKGANFFIEINSLNIGAFQLHQATESFYNTILLVFSDYKPKLHDLEKLCKLIKKFSIEIVTIFPTVTHEQSQAFDLLKRAYIDARYDKNYVITIKQLLYLIGRVEQLQQLTEKICTEYINNHRIDSL